MSTQEQRTKPKGDAILQGQEMGIESHGSVEDVALRTNFEFDDNLILDEERMSKRLAGQDKDVLSGDKREGVETVLHTSTAEPRFNVMSTTASGAKDLPDTKLGGDVHHLGESKLQHEMRRGEHDTTIRPSILEPGARTEGSPIL